MEHIQDDEKLGMEQLQTFLPEDGELKKYLVSLKTLVTFLALQLVFHMKLKTYFRQ